MEKHFNGEMTIEQVMHTHPEAGLVLASYHMGGCGHCAIAPNHKLNSAAEDYGIELDMLLDSLENLFNDYEYSEA